MKFKKLIGGLLLSTVLAACVGVFASSHKATAENVEATTFNATFEGKSGDVLYCKSNKGTFFPDNWHCTMHLWGGNSATAADNDIYVCNDNYAPYNDGTNYWFALRVPYGTGGVSVTYTNLQICRRKPDKSGYIDYSSEVTISTGIKNKPTNLVEYVNWSGPLTITTTKYTHYGVKSGDHVYVDASACPGWIDASSTDNTNITIFVTATNGENTYIYLWGGANDVNENANWPGKKIYEQGAWVYNNSSSQGVAAINVDRSLYQHMIINHNNGEQTKTYDFVDDSKYKGFYFNGHDKNVGTWDAGSDYSTNAKIGVYFSKSSTFNGDSWGNYRNGSSYVTAYARKVEGQNNKYLYEVLAPQQNNVDVVWNLVIVGRFKNSSTSPAWGDVLHQKTDFYYTSALHSYNEFKINGWTGGMYTCSDTISNTTRANYYGAYLTSQMTCDGAGNRTYESSGLTNAKNEYEKYLSNDIQYYLWETKVEDASGDCKNALERYDYIFFFKKYYPLTDSTYEFIGRRNFGSGKTPYNSISLSLFGLTGGDATSLLAIIIISSATVASVGGYFFFRKKKEN